MDQVTLHSSWRGIATTVGGGSTLLALGVLGFVAGGVNVIPIVLFVAGAVFVLITLFDYPIRATFSADGVERKAVLRRQRLAWEDVRELSRLRPRRAGPWRPPAMGGLLAHVGRRRYLLVDQLESPLEFDAVVAVVGEETAERLTLDTMSRPPDDTNPTWIYRRSRWAPDSSRGR